jgi:hypothetical protein
MKEYRKLATPPPTEELRGREYYHGTSDRNGFNGIRDKGLIPNLKPKHEGKFSAQEGRGYLTSNIELALCYAFTQGANWDFLEMAPERRDYNLYPPDIIMGYILVFDGNDLGDIEPDEDKVMEMVHEKKFPWLNAIAKEFYKDGVDNGLGIDLDDYYELISEDAWWWDSLHYGKQLITMMTPEQRLQICEAGGSIANQGIIHPVAGWKLSSRKVDKLNSSGTNFFELAEWIF